MDTTGWDIDIWTDSAVGRITEYIEELDDPALADHMRDGGRERGVMWSDARGEGYATDEIASMAADGFPVDAG